MRSDQTRADQMRSDQIRSDQTRADQIRYHSETHSTAVLNPNGILQGLDISAQLYVNCMTVGTVYLKDTNQNVIRKTYQISIYA